VDCGRQRKWCCGIASCGKSLKNIGRAFIKPSLSIYRQLPEVLRRPVETIPRKRPRQSPTGAVNKRGPGSASANEKDPSGVGTAGVLIRNSGRLRAGGLQNARCLYV